MTVIRLNHLSVIISMIASVIVSVKHTLMYYYCLLVLQCDIDIKPNMVYPISVLFLTMINFTLYNWKEKPLCFGWWFKEYSNWASNVYEIHWNLGENRQNFPLPNWWQWLLLIHDANFSRQSLAQNFKNKDYTG